MVKLTEGQDDLNSLTNPVVAKVLAKATEHFAQMQPKLARLRALKRLSDAQVTLMTMSGDKSPKAYRVLINDTILLSLLTVLTLPSEAKRPLQTLEHIVKAAAQAGYANHDMTDVFGLFEARSLLTSLLNQRSSSIEEFLWTIDRLIEIGSTHLEGQTNV